MGGRIARSEIDWPYWLPRRSPPREIPVWQGAALSLELDPDKMHPSGAEWQGADPRDGPYFEARSFPNPRVAEEFRKRLKLLTEALPRDPATSTPQQIRQMRRRPGEFPVTLAWVAACLVHHKRKPMAPQLRKLLPTTPTDIVTIPDAISYDPKLNDIQQAYDALRAKNGKSPSIRAVADESGYNRVTVSKRWPRVVKTSQNKPKPAT